MVVRQIFLSNVIYLTVLHVSLHTEQTTFKAFRCFSEKNTGERTVTYLKRLHNTHEARKFYKQLNYPWKGLIHKSLSSGLPRCPARKDHALD